jgi:ABC-type transport system involved in cytochrome c biogenesis permease component
MILILSSFFASILTIPMLAQETDSGISYSSSATGQISPIVWVIDVVVIILIIAAMWKIFAKAGQPGWAAIIPIYNWVVWCKIVGRSAWWVLLLLICFPIIYIILCIDLAKSFGKGVGFALGLIFLSIIFFPILGFGSAQYQGPSAGAAPAA